MIPLNVILKKAWADSQSIGGYRQSLERRERTGTIWPYGGFSLGTRPSPGFEVRDMGRGSPESQTAPPTRPDSTQELSGKGDSGSGLGLSEAPNPHNGGARGRRGVTVYGQKVIKSVAAILERECGRDNLSFLTVTLPSLTEGETASIGSWWGSAIGRLLQWLSRKLRVAGLSTAVISVTEFQPGRLGRGDLACHHAHILFQGRHRYGAWVVSKGAVLSYWESELGRRLGRAVSGRSSTRIERVRKSAVAYLGKYLTKGVSVVKEMIERGGEDLLPGQWWNRTGEALAIVKRFKLSGRVTGEYLAGLIDWLILYGDGGEGVKFSPVWIDLGGGPVLMGWGGSLPEYLWKESSELLSGVECD